MSFLWLTILSALRILRRNPLRAGLTMLGIIIGIGAVVAMPMMIPSMVSPARSGLRRRIRSAESVVSQRKDMGRSFQ